MSSPLELGALSPEEVSRCLTGEAGRVVEAAVRVACRGFRIDLDTLVAEVQSELALRMLSGRFSGFDPDRSSFPTYLAAAARNIARDLELRPRRHERLKEIAGNSSPEERLLDRERRLMVRKAIRTLARSFPEDARILRDRYLKELSCTEVSRRTGIPLRKLYLRAHRARKRLAGLLRDVPAGAFPAA